MINFLPLFLIAFHPVKLVFFGKKSGQTRLLIFLHDLNKTLDRMVTFMPCIWISARLWTRYHITFYYKNYINLELGVSFCC